jgi:hypothetical protein
MELRLFKLQQDKIIFPIAQIPKGYGENSQQLNEFLSKMLNITVNFDNGRSIFYSKTIDEIIREGDNNNT